MQTNVNDKSSFWTKTNKKSHRTGIEKLRVTNDHPLVSTISEYDCVQKSTLDQFKVGILEQYGHEWLAFPYQSGLQLYRRENGEKVIRMIKGSIPRDSFFQLTSQPEQDTLIVAKSPRETMLLHQLIGDQATIIGLTTGETDSLSNIQEQYLREGLKGINSVYVFLDTDTSTSKQIAMSLTSNIQNITNTDALYIDISAQSNQTYKDITDAIRDGKGKEYVQNLIENAKMPKMPPSISGSQPLDEPEISTLSSKVYNKLPRLLKDLCSLIDKDYQKDVFLLASLPVIASHLDNVIMEHYDGTYTPDLFSLVIAHSASGKGFALKAKALGGELNKQLQDIKPTLREQKEEVESQSDKINRRLLFLAANSSDRAFYDQLQANQGKGLIFESEIDTLLKAFHQDWGDFSDILRKAFHHEDISINRKNEQYSISNPSLSVFLTGTVDQYQRLFNNTENGFYSRWCIYTFKAPYEWLSHQPTQQSQLLEENTKKVSLKLYKLYLQLKQRKKPLVMKMNKDQWKLLDSTFEKIYKSYVNDGYSQALISTVKRSPIIALRIATTLTLIRLFDEYPEAITTKEAILPQSEDLDIALEIATTTSRHSSHLFHKHLQKYGGDIDPRLTRVLSCLPEQFTTSEAVEIADQIGYPERTLKRKLNKLTSNGRLKKVKHGVYQKPMFYSSN